MADIEGGAISSVSGMRPISNVSRPEIDILNRLHAAAKAAPSQAAHPDSLTAQVRSLGARAQEIQKTACTAWAAMDALEAVEQALGFALDGASEARRAQSLPTAALERVQKQVDLAILTLDHHMSAASFGDMNLFDGNAFLEIDDAHLDLPRLSSRHIGGSWVASVAAERVETGEVEYSQSVASVAAGGPNSLESWPEGAAMALEAGLESVRNVREGLRSFYESKVLPAVGELTVALSNALAAQIGPDGFADALAAISAVRTEMQLGRSTPTVGDGKGVLRLLG